MGVCPRLEFDDITLIYCMGYFMVRLSFYSIALLIYDVISLPDLRVPVITISSVICISFNGR